VIHVLADSGVNTTVVAAFAVGFVSFISPCVLPLVPGYLSAISGVSFAELQEGENRKKVIGPALLFCLSFTVMFVALGMTATGIGKTLAEHRLLIQSLHDRDADEAERILELHIRRTRIELRSHPEVFAATEQT